jgi:predicted acetyltransferase
VREPFVRGHLSEPTVEVHASFLRALDEYHREDLHADLRAEILADPGKFLEWAESLGHAGLAGMAADDRDRVPHRVLWWVAGGEYIGRMRINLELNDSLRDFGGHIGYDIRPSARRRGHATSLLAAGLRIANGFGIDPAL